MYTMDETKVMEYFLELLGQIKLFHWATLSYPKHKALDHLHDSLSELVDEFVEVYIGRFKKQPVKQATLTLKAHTDPSKMIKYLEDERDTLRKMHASFQKTTELQTILDDMMKAVNQTLYLLHLD